MDRTSCRWANEKHIHICVDFLQRFHDGNLIPATWELTIEKHWKHQQKYEHAWLPAVGQTKHNIHIFVDFPNGSTIHYTHPRTVGTVNNKMNFFAFAQPQEVRFIHIFVDVSAVFQLSILKRPA